MLNKVKQIAALLNMPVWVMLATILVLVLVVIKLIQTVLSSKSSKKNKFSCIIDKNGNVKASTRKRRNRKQRPFDMAMPQRGINGNEESRATTTTFSANGTIPTVETEDIDNVTKKPDKKKGKAKKKKAASEDTTREIVPVSKENQSVLEEDGEWQTVRTKEQRREKKRLDAVESLPLITTTVSKQVTPVPTTPVYTSIPSMAKDIAPRFARAAGEEWMEGASKRQGTSISKSSAPPLVSRSPMVPASFAESSRTSSSKWPTSDVTTSDIWNNKTSATVMGYPSPQVSTWNPIPSTKPEDLTWAQNVNGHTWPTKPWEGAGSNAVETSDWPPADPKTDDWVHVSTPSPTVITSNETWSCATDIYTKNLRQWKEVRLPVQSSVGAISPEINRENFLMEPEGITVDPDDPWNTNIDSYQKEGDWSPPEATWNNSNEEWKVPAVPLKPQPTYFDESSDEEKTTVSAPNQSSVSQTIVGITNPLPQANQSANKKARRRRRKKQVPEVSAEVKEDSSILQDSPAIIPDVTEIILKEEALPEAMEDSGNAEAWSTRTSKKKKSRVRKEE